jgi:hypothetical protein
MVYLIKASAKIEIIEFHLHNMIELKLINETTGHQTLAKLNEIARMAGGWRKSIQ